MQTELRTIRRLIRLSNRRIAEVLQSDTFVESIISSGNAGEQLQAISEAIRFNFKTLMEYDGQNSLSTLSASENSISE